YEHHTLNWLYERSVGHLTVEAKRVLQAAGILAAAKFPVSAAAAALQVPGSSGGDSAQTSLEAEASQSRVTPAATQGASATQSFANDSGESVQTSVGAEASQSR